MSQWVAELVWMGCWYIGFRVYASWMQEAGVDWGLWGMYGLWAYLLFGIGVYMGIKDLYKD